MTTYLTANIWRFNDLLYFMIYSSQAECGTSCVSFIVRGLLIITFIVTALAGKTFQNQWHAIRISSKFLSHIAGWVSLFTFFLMGYKGGRCTTLAEHERAARHVIELQLLVGLLIVIEDESIFVTYRAIFHQFCRCRRLLA